MVDIEEKGRITSYTWFIEGGVATGAIQRRVYRLPNEAAVKQVYMRRAEADPDPIVVDINADDVSIFDVKPAIPGGVKEHLFTSTPIADLAAGVILSLEVDSGAATDLVVQLDVEDILDDSRPVNKQRV